MLTLILSLLLSAPIHDSRADDLAALVSQETGEPEALIRVVMSREAGNRPDAIRYCTRWEKRAPRGLRCTAEASCYSGCRRKSHVWRNRLDLGMCGIRDVPWKVDGVRTYGFSWARRLGVSSDCLIQPLCASLAAAEIIRRLKALPPKRCNLKGVPDSVGSWLTYYAAGGLPSDTRGCDSRKARLELAGMGGGE